MFFEFQLVRIENGNAVINKIDKTKEAQGQVVTTTLTMPLAQATAMLNDIVNTRNAQLAAIQQKVQEELASVQEVLNALA
jgi:hypothetical protein